MKFFFAPYKLQVRDSSSAREGALLKVEWSEEKIGYADLHPWPELGDESLTTQLDQLKKLKRTPLLEQAILLASRDADGRQKKINIYDDQPLLKNNALITSLNGKNFRSLSSLVDQGFTTFKIKAGLSVTDETKFINNLVETYPVKLRLDFNNRLSSQDFEKYQSVLSAKAKEQIEYVEDPFFYESTKWQYTKKSLKLALDWNLNQVSSYELPEADVLIIKPTRDNVETRVAQAKKWGMKVTVTSHMGHPLGVMQCMQVAQSLHRDYPQIMNDPGCMTFDVYRSTEFHSDLNVEGPYIKKAKGYGIGFDVSLKGQKWLPL